MQIYTYRTGVLVPEQSRTNKMPDLTGFDVEATDGSIGKVDEASYQAASSCLVVDTGFWIFGKKRMIPAGVIQRVDPDDEKIYVSMTKDQIKGAPDYDADRHRANEQVYHEEVGGYYQSHAN